MMNKAIITLISILITLGCSSNKTTGTTVIEDNSNEISFHHGVASGDPLSDRVIIWTRVSTSLEKEVVIQWQVSENQSFERIVREGSTTTNAEADYTAKIDVNGLTSNTSYFYRFISKGVTSPIGKTKTLDTTGESTLSIGVVSCSNYQFGYFSAYRHLAQKEIDLVLHLGDYFYEHGPDGYGDKDFERKHNPPREILSLEDYRMRYAQYRTDSDLQLLHKNHPFITIWDDHEITNNAYKDGAQNHQEDEGDYMERRALAKKAYYEWMPIRPRNNEELYRDFDLGPLADIVVLDERLEGRTMPVESQYEASESMLGSTQLKWFEEKLSKSDAIWKVIGNQVIFSPLNLEKVRPKAPKNLDAWDGYSIERDGIVEHIENNKIDNVVFVTGDTHTSWAFEIPKSIDDYKKTNEAVAIEFGTPSITSSNWNDGGRATDEEVLGAEILVMADNPHLKYANARDHGYFILDLTSENATAKWYYVDDIKNPESGEYMAKSISVSKGSTQLFE